MHTHARTHTQITDAHTTHACTHTNACKTSTHLLTHSLSLSHKPPPPHKAVKSQRARVLTVGKNNDAGNGKHLTNGVLRHTLVVASILHADSVHDQLHVVFRKLHTQHTHTLVVSSTLQADSIHDLLHVVFCY